MKTAIQGGKTSFHHEATESFFGKENIEIIECRTFRKLCTTLVEGDSEIAVMAIENTLAGSILPNYSLINEYGLKIIGEIYHHIKHNLIALPNETLSTITTVKSHPMALSQCSKFLEEQPHIKGFEHFDTAESAREIKEYNIAGQAAIASKMCAEYYGLKILGEGIQNLDKNYTRFLILSTKEKEIYGEEKKVSIFFTLKHKPGSLARVLATLHYHELNMSLIQSIPIPGKMHEYNFHIDFTIQNKDQLETVMHELGNYCLDLKVLGAYKPGTIKYEY